MPRPETGSQPSSTANTIASSGPSQKFGNRDAGQRERHGARNRPRVPRHTAAITPSGMAITIATSIAASASSAVAGTRSTIIVVTGWPVRNDVAEIAGERAAEET